MEICPLSVLQVMLWLIITGSLATLVKQIEGTSLKYIYMYIAKSLISKILDSRELQSQILYLEGIN